MLIGSAQVTGAHLGLLSMCNGLDEPHLLLILIWPLKPHNAVLKLIHQALFRHPEVDNAKHRPNFCRHAAWLCMYHKCISVWGRSCVSRHASRAYPTSWRVCVCAGTHVSEVGQLAPDSTPVRSYSAQAQACSRARAQSRYTETHAPTLTKHAHAKHTLTENVHTKRTRSSRQAGKLHAASRSLHNSAASPGIRRSIFEDRDFALSRLSAVHTWISFSWNIQARLLPSWLTSTSSGGKVQVN